MNITSKFFSFNMWEWFLHSSVLERTEYDISKINWHRGIILLIPIVLVSWSKFPLCHTLIISISAFRDQISILIVGCVTMWSRVSHQLVSKLKDEIVWLDSPNHRFSVKVAWEQLRSHRQMVEWHDIVWFKNAVPRHSFLLWMAKESILDRIRGKWRYG
jgi:hypothetical protein